MRHSLPAMNTDAIRSVRKPWLRRIAKVSGYVFGGLVLLLVLAIGFLQTPWGKSIVRGRIERALAKKVNGSVRVGGVDYSVLFGSLSLHDIEIRDASGGKAIAIGSLELDLDRGALLGKEIVLPELAIAGLDVNVVKRADGTSNLTGLFKQSQGKPLGHVRIAKLAIAGSATVTKPGGKTIAVRELDITGSVDARPVTKQLELAIDHVTAKVATADKTINVALRAITVDRKRDSLQLDIATLAAGCVNIDAIAAHVALEQGKPRGQQSITIGKARVDSKQLAAIVGHDVLLDDITMDLSLTGPANDLALRGAIRTRDASLTLDGTLDIVAAVPRYQLAVVAKGKSADVLVPHRGEQLPAIGSDIRIAIKGAGVSKADMDAQIDVAVGPTTIDQIAVEGLTAKAVANHGTYRLDQLIARGVGFEVGASGELVGTTLDAQMTVSGNPAHTMDVLAAAGIAVPRKVPRIGKLALAVSANGKLDGDLAVTLAPTKIAFAGGSIGIRGDAKLDHKQLRIAQTQITLAKLDLVSLAHLAGRPPKAKGTLSGSVALTRTATARHGTYDFEVALSDKPLTVTIGGDANETSATTHAEVRRTTDRALIASLAAQLSLDAKGLVPTGPMHVTVDVGRRQLAELATLLPERLRRKLPVGDIAVHAELAGSPARPAGTITMSSTGRQDVSLTATLAPTEHGVAIATDGSLALQHSTLATLRGTVSLPPLFAGKHLDLASVRRGLSVDAVVEIPERPVASLATLRANLAKLDGTLGGRIAVRGAVQAPSVDAALTWRGYRTATGATGETKLVATGTPVALKVQIDHGGALAITADVDRSSPDRIAVVAHARSAKAKLLPLLPAFAVQKLAGADLGTLDWNMDGSFVLVRGATGLALDQVSVTGSLDVQGGAFQLPNTKRRYHDIALAVASEPAGLRIRSSLHESDIEKHDRALTISGLLALDKLRPQHLDLSLAARDWLVFGGEKLGKADAPRATATFDIGVAVDLTSAITGVDVTVHSLALRSPDRHDRAHFYEEVSPGGDIIYTSDKLRVGKLPVALAQAPVPNASPRQRHPLDVRVHIPEPIRIQQTPMDLMARGELMIKVRDAGVETRGTLTMDSGKLNLFGHDHELVAGSVTFSDEHPHGWMDMTFERKLPDFAARGLSTNAGAARISLQGPPTKPKASLAGGAGAAMVEVMAMYNAGRPLNDVRPGMPASASVQAPRGDQLFMLTFMASNLPQLLFLDRVSAWSSEPHGAITNLEAEKYTNHSRVRAVVRPVTPGRSNAELQYDRLLISNDRAAVGVGVRAGDRLGGGVGLFFEWSSR